VNKDEEDDEEEELAIEIGLAGFDELLKPPITQSYFSLITVGLFNARYS
jgi:hypothetical protein